MQSQTISQVDLMKLSIGNIFIGNRNLLRYLVKSKFFHDVCTVLSKVVRRYNVLLKPLLIMTQVFFKDHVKTLNHPTRVERRKAGISRLKKKCRNSPVKFLKDGKIQ